MMPVNAAKDLLLFRSGEVTDWVSLYEALEREIGRHSAVMSDVWTGICRSSIIIADCTSRNANVFYEIGLAHTVGKSVVLITQNSEDVPFDLRYIRYISYEYTPTGMKKFESDLANTIKTVLRELGSS